MTDYFDPNQVANNQTGGELGPMDMRPFTGYAGPPRMPYYSIPAATGPLRYSLGKTFAFCALWGMVLAFFVTLAGKPGFAVVGVAPIGVWLVIVTFSVVRRRSPHVVLRVRARRAMRKQVRIVRELGSVLDLVPVPPEIATRPGIRINRVVLSAAVWLVNTFGVKVNSGYRTREENDVLVAQHKAARNSDHLRGNAVDFTGPQQQMQALYAWAQQQKFPYVESWDKAGGNHVHISFIR